MKRTILLVALLLTSVACSDKNVTIARDSIAAASGVIAKAIDQYGDQCSKDNTSMVCVTISKAVHSEGLALDALEAYCGLGPASAPDAKCQPVNSMAPALGSAISNLNQIIQDLSGLLNTPAKATPKMVVT